LIYLFVAAAFMESCSTQKEEEMKKQAATQRTGRQNASVLVVRGEKGSEANVCIALSPVLFSAALSEWNN